MIELLNYIPEWELIVFSAVFGSLWGSFANVVIVRWPKELSVVSPPSHCFSCGTTIKWYDNIPIISYIILQGKCRVCKTKFSPRYAFVELAMGIISASIMFLALKSNNEITLNVLAVFAIWFIFTLGLLIIAMIDLEHYLIPNEIVLPGIILGILANMFIFPLGYIEPIVSAVVGYAGIRLLFIDGYRLLRGQAGMGLGDAKLMAMLGAFLGYEGALFSLFAAAFQGLIIGIIMVLFRRKEGLENEPVFEEDSEPQDSSSAITRARVPFGPFLALAALEYLFIGDWVLTVYTNFIARLLYGL